MENYYERDNLKIYTEDGNSWFTSANVAKQAPIKKAYTKKKDEVVYPIFLQASELIEDKFWVEMLVNASQNKFKRGFKFKNGILTSKIKNKIYPHDINMECPEKALRDFLFFMREVSGIVSEQDLLDKKVEIDEYVSQHMHDNTTTWSKVRTNLHFNVLINRYVEKIRDSDNLTPKQTKNLKDILLTGINTQKFNSKTIFLVDGEIDNITGLVKTQSGKFIIQTPKKESKEPYYEDYTYDSTNYTNEADLPANTKIKSQLVSKLLYDFFDKLNKGLPSKMSKYIIKSSKDGVDAHVDPDLDA